jgi:hypothetical protein
MKTKTVALILVFFFPYGLSAVTQNNKRIEFKTINGIEVVLNPENPVPPKNTPTILIINKELSIEGIRATGDFLFTEASSIAVDSEGNIYVCDKKSCHINIFNTNGKHIKTFGKRGQGPGELSAPNWICLTKSEEILVADFRKHELLFFSKEGEFLKSLNAGSDYLINPSVDSLGNIVSNTLVYTPAYAGYKLIKHDRYLKPIFQIASMPYPDMNNFNPFMPKYTWKVAKNDNIIYGYSDIYELQVLDPNGKVIKKIIKKYDPVKITTAEKEEEIRKAPSYVKFDMPSYHTAFQGFKLDDEGKIFVLTWEKRKNKKGYYYDVFDSKGRYIAKIFLEAKIIIWKNRKLYTVEEDKHGLQSVIRYNTEWK